MNGFTLTDEQQAVVEACDPQLVVRAAAGAGKTRVLVSRYLKHVLVDRIQPDQILTVTFTRKAAAEMKRRIVQGLVEAGRYAEAQVAETGPIQTIHGWCERILRENAIAAGVDPDFQILDAARRSRWQRDVLRDVVSEATQITPHAGALLEMLAHRREFGDSDPNGMLFGFLERCMGALRSTLHTPEAIERLHEDPESLRRNWRQLMEEELGPEVSLSSGWREARQTLKAKGAEIPEWMPTPAAGDAADGHEIEAARLTCAIAALGCEAWRRFEAKMVEAQLFDFGLLESATVRLLTERDDVRERIRGAYQVLLVDEAQDLNPVQYRLLSTLGLRFEMAVGDAQQSIYGFRQADVRLFDERTRSGPSMMLSRNFRSRPEILVGIDRLFALLWNDYAPMLHPSEPADGVRGLELWVLPKSDSQQVAAWIAELCEEESPRDIAVLTHRNAAAGAMAQRLEMCNIPARAVGGTETFYARMEVRDLANALEALTDPDDDLALLSMLHGPIAELSLDAIIGLARQSPVAEAILSYEPATDDDRVKLAAFREWFVPLSAVADRLPAWETLTAVISGTPLMTNLATRPNSRQTLANVRKLLTLAAQEPTVQSREFARAIRDVQALKHREGDAPALDETSEAVVCMTVHKAKGLEFPVVVVPDLCFVTRQSAKALEIDMDSGLMAVKLDAPGVPMRDFLAARRKRKEAEEHLRLLYVALTRAQRRLCLVVSDQPGGRTLASKLWSMLDPEGGNLPGVVIRRPAD